MGSLAPRPVRVVFVTTVFEGVDTGPGTYARYLWKAFRDDPEIEFHLVAPQVGEQHPRLHVAGSGKGSLSLYQRVQETGLSVARDSPGLTIVHGNSTHSMGRFVGYEGPLLVQVNDYYVASVGRRPWRIVGSRGLRRLLGMTWRYFEERRVLRHATLGICNSAYTASEVQRAYALAADRLRVVHKAVDTSSFARPASLPPDPAANFPVGSRLLFVGSNWRIKGLDVLLEAVASLAPTHRDLLLSVMGPHEHDAALRSRIRALRLEDRVMLSGRATAAQVAQWLWHSDVLVLPSRYEALGVAVLEAMAAGVPVVAARVGGIPEIIRSPDEGVLVAPGQASSLAAALAVLLGDPARRRALGAAGLRRVQQFSRDDMVQKVRSLYLELARAADSDQI